MGGAVLISWLTPYPEQPPPQVLALEAVGCLWQVTFIQN